MLLRFIFYFLLHYFSASFLLLTEMDLVLDLFLNYLVNLFSVNYFMEDSFETLQSQKQMFTIYRTLVIGYPFLKLKVLNFLKSYVSSLDLKIFLKQYNYDFSDVHILMICVR